MPAGLANSNRVTSRLSQDRSMAGMTRPAWRILSRPWLAPREKLLSAVRRRCSYLVHITGGTLAVLFSALAGRKPQKRRDARLRELAEVVQWLGEHGLDSETLADNDP